MTPAPNTNRSPRRLRGDKRRLHCVSVRLNAVEFRQLKTWAVGAGKKKGQILREIALATPPAIVPEANQARWTELAHTLSNLNQLTAALHQGRLQADVRPLLTTLIPEIQAFRAELRGETLP